VAGVEESVEPPAGLLARSRRSSCRSCVARAASQTPSLSQAVDEVTGSKTRSNLQETHSRRSAHAVN
jgi:hypothetical protein